MAEAKKSSNKKAPASEKRKAADDALEARIAQRKAATAPKEPTPVAVAEVPAAQLPFEPNVKQPKAEKPVKEKKERKPRTPKAEAPATGSDVSGLVAKIEERVSRRLEKEHKAFITEQEKEHKAEIKQLKADHAAELKKRQADAKTSVNSLLDAETKKAYNTGHKAGYKLANKDITAALKGK